MFGWRKDGVHGLWLRVPGPTGQEGPQSGRVHWMGRGTLAASQAPSAVGHVPHLPPHKALPTARTNPGSQILGLAAPPLSETPVRDPRPSSPSVPASGELIQGSRGAGAESGAGGVAL